ncbi:MAG TPA: hypothetical protein VL171_00855 [Verrucomicrobiae bacterium]|nr:hypothetical protein [Verrucomicrobiae bacterium]
MTVNLNAAISVKALPHDAESKRHLARELARGLIGAKLSRWQSWQTFTLAQVRDAANSARECVAALR